MNVVIVIFIPLAALVLLFRAFLFQPFDLPTTSMAPTLVEGDRFMAAKFAYGYSVYSIPTNPPLFRGRIFGRRPAYGDVVVFRLKDGVTDYVKRVVGLPGDRIQMRNGLLHINGKPVVREQVFAGDTGCGQGSTSAKRWRERLPNGVAHETLDCVDGSFLDTTPEVRVPADHYFMLGDNRDNSVDSRVTATVGYVHHENLLGRMAFVYWSAAVER